MNTSFAHNGLLKNLLRRVAGAGILVAWLASGARAQKVQDAPDLGRIPNYPARWRHAAPVRDINDAAVFTMNETTLGSDYGLDVARKVGSDVLIRAWFKWCQAPRVSDWTRQPAEAHRIGALFGGGITCSALYDPENDLTHEQVLDMATRGTAGQLIDAWDQPGIRHGSLSSPTYLDYLFRWCREQIDAGADYLFMDENTAALSDREGYDDHSLADFRSYLAETCPRTRGWSATDPRWRRDLDVALDDARECPTGRIDSFDYRAHLRRLKAFENPSLVGPLFAIWCDFKRFRDDRAWKALTDRIRAYGRAQGHPVFISGNGIVKYVDMEVLGVWDRWTTDNGHVDLRTSQIPAWRAIVSHAWSTAGRRVPVVLFHDWGIGDPPFPWMAVPPAERQVWMRTRGAEIYAAGGFFAFPVMGPFGCDAARDGSLPLIAHLTAYYQRHRDLYLRSRWLGSERLGADRKRISLAASWLPRRRALVLHAINRDVQAGVLIPTGPVTIRLPIASAPVHAVALSPDFDGAQPVRCRLANGALSITLPRLDAYSAVVLDYPHEPNVAALVDPARLYTISSWTRPEQSEFRVLSDGSVEGGADLGGIVQGMLHREMRNPPTFLVNAGHGAQLQAHVRAVATAGARLQFRIDGRVAKSVELPDRDGKNDSSASEYDLTCSCPIPPGRHRVTVDNVGGDWAVIDWYQFVGKLGTP